MMSRIVTTSSPEPSMISARTKNSTSSPQRITLKNTRARGSATASPTTVSDAPMTRRLRGIIDG